MRILLRFSLLLLMVLLLACGDDAVTPVDGGTDTSSDGGTDVPVIDGHTIPGLSAGVDAHFDDRGVLNLDCESNEDCIAALGYFHARDRFVQMDIRRRITTGRLSQMLGEIARPIALPIDVENRALYSTRNGDPAEEAMLAEASAETLSWLEAYARGVNSWIADVKVGRNGTEFPREFNNAVVFDYDPERVPDWQPSDSVATVLALINSLTNRSKGEIQRANSRMELRERLGEALGETVFRDLYDIRPDIDSPIIEDFGSAPMASLSGPGRCAPSGNPLVRPSQVLLGDDSGWFAERFLSYPHGESSFGSNNWAVGPSLSASGNALFSNDPHLGMSNPATWYVAHLDSKTNGSGDLHVSGLSFAGLPFVLIGQNENVAWGATTTNFDMTDVYVEEVSDDGTTVTFRGEQVPIINKTATIAYSDGSTMEAELQFVPHHGPILPRENETDPVLSLRWTGNDATTDVNFLTELSRATSVAEAQTALQQITTIGQNWVVVDTAGSIGWFPYNRLPKRPWATSYNPTGTAEAVPWLPLDGRGDFEWDTYYEYSELPQLLNPEQGYIITANNDMTGSLFDSDPTAATFGVFQTAVAAGYRHERIKNLILASAAHDLESMEALVGDTYSLIGEQLTPLVLAAAEPLTLSANAQKVADALGAWNFECPTGLSGEDAEAAPLSASAEELTASSGCAAFHVAIRELNRLALDDEGIPGERGPNIALVKMLHGEIPLAGEIYWDDLTTEDVVETRDDIFLAALDAAGEFLVTALGEDETKWAWGRIHILTLRSDVDTASGGLVETFNETGFANDGGLYTVDVANPESDYGHRSGASMRLVCEAIPSGPVCTLQLPGGQSSNPESPNYLSLLSDYLTNTSRPLNMDIAAASESAAVSIEITPP